MNPEHLAVLAALHVKFAALRVDGEFLPNVTEGPVVTLYRFKPSGATRVSLVEGLSKDIAITLGVESVQIAALPRENAIGLFIPNKVRKNLEFRDAVSAVWTSKAHVPICLGIDHNGAIIIEDLTTLPHLLIAGSTGSGKSTLLNSILSALCYCIPPERLRLVLADTKQVEFSLFERSKHLLLPVAKDVPAVIDVLDDLCQSVDNRLAILAKHGCQNIEQYHARVAHSHPVKMPYTILVIDELAEPLTDQRKESDEKGAKTYGKLAEYRLGKIVSKSRATGIHVIAATQRTSVRVVEGNIKANFPARVSFRLPSDADSRTILGTGGAQNLLAKGDMLFLSPNNPEVRRIHAPYASIEDIKMAVEMAERR